MTILSGFAMSPSITSVFPSIVIFFGGHQSARTIHFFLANLLFLFLIVHIVMIAISGFLRRMRSMITGGSATRKDVS
jgi:thiosulfate reductase cytochrome b subunit